MKYRGCLTCLGSLFLLCNALPNKSYCHSQLSQNLRQPDVLAVLTILSNKVPEKHKKKYCANYRRPTIKKALLSDAILEILNNYSFNENKKLNL